jgi:hypothetical protein
MVPRPYAIVSCDFVVMYSCSLVGMMDHLLRTFISILVANGAGSYNQGGYLDALAHVFVHNTNALHYFTPDMCVCVCVRTYIHTHIHIYDVMKDPFVLFILLPAMFFAIHGTGVYFPTQRA